MTLDLEVLADRLSLSQQCARVALGGGHGLEWSQAWLSGWTR